ncbi:methyl-accepting chemotaxis protein [Nibribacter koreensis]|uniref:Methyl-accepting transducer domain-containing protein n=1 Tax=Nibribacter koreensis TaxID=1084519 RepID=A0ABP8FV08_9BACT
MPSPFTPVVETFKEAVNQLQLVSSTLHHPEITALTLDANNVQEQLLTVCQQHILDAALLKEILGQTNLLALNLAIEAARLGGESGRSIALVAEKFRKITEELKQMASNNEHANSKTSGQESSVTPRKSWMKKLFRF